MPKRSNRVAQVALPTTPAQGRDLAIRIPTGARSPEAREVYALWDRLPTLDAKAAFANKSVDLLTRNWQKHWAALLEMLRLVRDHELYRKPEWVDAAASHPHGYDSFEAYFAARVRLPFDTFVGLEATARILESAGYRLDEMLALGYGEAKTRADTLVALEDFDLEHPSQQGKGKRTDLVYNIHKVRAKRPAGTSAQRALRRLRTQRPDLHARVLAGDCSPHAAMLEAGFRRQTATVPITDMAALAGYLRRKLSTEQLQALREALT